MGKRWVGDLSKIEVASFEDCIDYRIWNLAILEQILKDKMRSYISKFKY